MLTFVLYLVLTLCIVGFAMWAVENAPFISATIKPFIRWVIIVGCGIWVIVLLLSLFGFAGAPHIFNGPSPFR